MLKNASCTNSIGGAQTFDKTALVDTDFNDVMEGLVENMLKNFHCVQQEVNWLVLGAVCWLIFVLEEGNYVAQSPDIWLESKMVLKKFVSQSIAVLKSSKFQT